ncbi:hypothetical protein HOG98_08570 [bacterium]|jgi:hypothetical protein|nr:hypothetical protein [bacterium]
MMTYLNYNIRLKKGSFFQNILIVILCMVSMVGSPFAQEISGENLDLFSVGFVAQDLALVESTASFGDNNFGAFYNPSTLPDVNNFRFFTLQGKLSESVDVFSVTTLFSVLDLPISLSWVQIQASDIPLVASENVDQNTDLEPDSFSDYGAEGLIAATSLKINDSINVGLSTIAYIKRLDSVELGNAYGVSLTPGMYVKALPNLDLGVYCRNLFSYESWATNFEDQFLPEWHVGLSYSTPYIAFLLEEVIYPDLKYSIETKAGIEVTLIKNVVIRCGFQKSNTNAGIGINIEGVHLDYAFIGSSENRLGESSRFSIGVEL